MWSILMDRRVIVSCLLLLLLAGCAPEAETVAPATRARATASATQAAVTLAANTPAAASPEASVTSTGPAVTAEATAEATTTVTETPAAEATAAATAGVEPTQVPISGGFCSEVTRPALILYVSLEEYVVTNPLTGETCSLPFSEQLPARLQATADALYYRAEEGGRIVVHGLATDGTVEALPYTAGTLTAATLDFIVSEEGSLIAWSSTREDPDNEQSLISEIWVADIGTGQARLLASNVSVQPWRYLTPVRFSSTGETLVYTLQPDGLGGLWNTFTGRYDNLYTIPVAGGEPTLVYDCAADDLFLCIGDFTMFGVEPPTLATVDAEAGAVLVRNGAEVINTLPVAADYVGYPTFGPTGELVFYSADLAEDGTFPETASIYRVAPPTAPAELVISDPRILLPDRFLDDSHLVVGFLVVLEYTGKAVVNIQEGTLLPLEWPYAITEAVIPAEAPATSETAAPTEDTPCTDDSAFVMDVNVPDGTHFAPGTSFTKTWRLRNSGTCTWDASYRLDFVSGERMDGPESMSDGTSAIGQTVRPGEEVDISVALIAPQADGTYRRLWQLVAPDGTAFGAKPYVEIVVP